MVWITKRAEIFLYRYNEKDYWGVIIHKLTDDEFIFSCDDKSPLIKFTAIKEKW